MTPHPQPLGDCNTGNVGTVVTGSALGEYVCTGPYWLAEDGVGLALHGLNRKLPQSSFMMSRSHATSLGLLFLIYTTEMIP